MAIHKNKDEVATLIIRDKSYTLPIKKGEIGPEVVDVTNLYKQAGVFTYDPGFMSTASCESKITYIDGDKGELLYRGYPIAELAEKSSFIEVCYLLLYGELPTENQYTIFSNDVRRHTLVYENMRSLFAAFDRNAHPMAVMVGAVGALSAFYHDSLDIKDDNSRDKTAIQLIAKMSTLAAMAYKYSVGQPFVYPDNSLEYGANLLKMMFAVPSEAYVPNPIHAKAIEKLLILHADHEQNASTSTVRLAGSSGANPYAVVASGIASLWGPAHGGANEAVIKMLEQIGAPENIQKFVNKAKDPDDDFRLMGFGHRVYKNYDPRASVLKQACEEVLNDMKINNDPMLTIAMELEKIALSDSYFIEKKLYPNVDFYSGIIYKALGIPSQMFTVMFAIARTAGWISQWNEMIEDPESKIGRPRQLYTGHTTRIYTPVKNRG